MNQRLAASLALLFAISAPACASAITLFHVERNGHVFIDCIGVDLTDTASVKERLKELKRWNPHDLTVEFWADDGAPADLVSKYRKLVVSEGFRFGRSNRGPCN